MGRDGLIFRGLGRPVGLPGVSLPFRGSPTVTHPPPPRAPKGQRGGWRGADGRMRGHPTGCSTLGSLLHRPTSAFPPLPVTPAIWGGGDAAAKPRALRTGRLLGPKSPHPDPECFNPAGPAAAPKSWALILLKGGMLSHPFRLFSSPKCSFSDHFV